MKSLRLYRVVGSIAHISAGAVISLTDAQLAPRRHRLAIVQTVEGGAIVRAEQPLEFKVGETLGLADAPEKAQAERLVPVDGGDDGRERLVSRLPKVAAAKPARAPKKAAEPKPADAAGASPAAGATPTGAQPGGDVLQPAAQPGGDEPQPAAAQ